MLLEESCAGVRDEDKDKDVVGGRDRAEEEASCVLGAEECLELVVVGIRRLWSANGSLVVCVCVCISAGDKEISELEVAVVAEGDFFLNANLRFGARLARVSSRSCLSDLSAFF